MFGVLEAPAKLPGDSGLEAGDWGGCREAAGRVFQVPVPLGEKMEEEGE